MKGIVKTLPRPFWGLNTVILILYAAFVVIAQIFYSSDASPAGFVALSLGALLMIVLISPAVLWLLSRLNFYPRSQETQPLLKQVLVNGCFYLIPLAVFAVYFIGCFPGGYSVDSCDQYILSLFDKDDNGYAKKRRNDKGKS